MRVIKVTGPNWATQIVRAVNEADNDTVIQVDDHVKAQLATRAAGRHNKQVQVNVVASTT